ncbi:diflavin flavoprotein [Synechococcus elongatus IITB7]|uniref:diflavin flavoprotein n=1 Tax=Synechococcus elongatus TaxID=32046 RepID=UPI0030D2CC29
MVATAPAPRLSLAVETIGPNTTTIRSLDWDRSRFDIEFGLQNGTTYNSFLIEADRKALVDTSHAKFQATYVDQLRELTDISTLDYLIISHTEPDHSGLVGDILAIAPNVTVVGSKVALQFLENQVHRPFQKLQVKNGNRLDLGQGHELEFVSAPNLHWPDTIFTYDPASQILFTCDAFGMHFCDDRTFDEDLHQLEGDFQYYYECLMAPNARSVLAALKRMKALGEITTIATGHGPLLRRNLREWVDRYQHWSEQKATAETSVLIGYLSDYGYSDRLSQAIGRGLVKTGVAVEMVDLRAVDPQELIEAVSSARGIVLGTPPSQPSEAVASALSTIFAAAHNKQAIGLYDSYGGDDEPIDALLAQFRNLGLHTAFPPIRVKDQPTEAIYQQCEESGTDLGQWLTRADAIQTMKSLNSDLDKALGRLSGGLYIITARKGEVSGAMLASWVVQASFKPLGFTVAVAKDRAIESLMQVGDRFVLNVLGEDNYAPLMKHFLKRFPPGADRFAGVETQTASNGSPLLTAALAYLECEVVSRMDCSDHWLVYCQVDQGRVSRADVRTAVHHRKVGNHY